MIHSWAKHLAHAGRQSIVLLVLAVSGSLIAVGQQITGSIAGTITDEQGAVVAGATVTATNVDTGFSRLAKTDNAGGYRIQYLPVGKYQVVAMAQGFKKFTQQNIVLTVDQTQTLNITPAVGAQTQTVVVTEAPPLVNTSSAELGRTVQPAEIIGLLLVNRNVYTAAVVN